MTKTEYEENGSWGMLSSIDLKECNGDTIRNEEKIREFVYSLTELINVKRFGECVVVHFADDNEDVAGFSMTQLIESSLISGHFANRTNNVYLDVFSCEYYDPVFVEKFAAEFFEAIDSKSTVLLRK